MVARSYFKVSCWLIRTIIAATLIINSCSYSQIQYSIPIIPHYRRENNIPSITVPQQQSQSNPVHKIPDFHNYSTLEKSSSEIPVVVSGHDINSASNHRYLVPGDSFSKSISGDYCWDPLFHCDTAKSILYCINGRCTCPTKWTLTPGNLPLDTVWDPTTRRCVSLIGSGCHTVLSAFTSTNSPTPTFSNQIGNQGYVYCQPGIRCHPHPTLQIVGTCGSSSLREMSAKFLIIMIVSLTSWYWGTLSQVTM